MERQRCIHLSYITTHNGPIIRPPACLSAFTVLSWQLFCLGNRSNETGPRLLCLDTRVGKVRFRAR